MSRSRSDYVCETCGLPVRVRTRKGVPRWTHMANAATAGQVCAKASAIKRGTPASQRALEPGAVFTIWRPAGVITIGGTPYRQRFGQGSFADLINTLASIKRGGEEVGTGIFTAAQVAPDGSGVTLTVEVLTPVPARAAA